MRVKMSYAKLALAALTAGLLASLSLAGCVGERGVCDVGETDGFRMTVTIFTSFPLTTRADDHTDDDSVYGTDAENYIDFAGNDFRIALFDNSGKYLLTLDATNDWTPFPPRPDPSGDGYSSYQMECEVKFSDFVTQADIDNIKTNGFQTMVLANWQSIDGPNAYGDLFTPAGNRQTLTDIWKDGDHYNYNYTATASNNDNWSSSWTPDHTKPTKRLIPMFGIAKASGFKAQSGGELRSAAKIPMQRAMAKIEVLDQLAENNQPNLEVSDVRMTRYNLNGRFIPDVAANPGWNQEWQVGSSSCPADVRQSTKALSFIRDASDKKWIAYVPEMQLGKLTVNDDGEVTSTERPYLEIGINTKEGGNSGDNSYTSGIYPVHFARYENNVTPTIPDDSWNHILRNHIYRFAVKKVGFTVKLHLHVIPWVADEDEVWDYTDNVTVQKMLEWTEDSYEQRNDDTGEMVLWIERGKRLEGIFNITTPINGRWYARLIPIGDAKTDAVSFVDSDGNVPDGSSACLEISGRIDTDTESPTPFYIQPTNFDNDAESKFLLEFFVENMGSWMEVPMTGASYKYYTIVRKSNIIN